VRDVSIGFLLTTFLVVVSPGPGVLYTVGAGLHRGRRPSIAAAVGCTLGIVPHMAAAILGLAALLYASSVAFQTLKYIGVAYLLLMAWSTLRERGALELDEKAGPRTSAHVIRSTILVDVLNPKLSIFFFAFLPQFVTAGDSQRLLHMLELSTVFMLTTLVVFIGYGLAAARVRRSITSRPRVLAWLRRTFAAAFVGLGVKLALAER
jgi:threonine/homoserine/homoserine lactone efflux protein